MKIIEIGSGKGEGNFTFMELGREKLIEFRFIHKKGKRENKKR